MSQKKLSIRIDGELISALEGQTILQAAKANGKYIPTLCDMEGLTPVGACRVCIVEVSGVGRLLPACTTPIQEGMSVTTNSAKLTLYRRISVELLLVERNHVCAVCVSNGHCELQSMATTLGISTVRFAYNYPSSPPTSPIRGLCSTTTVASSVPVVLKWRYEEAMFESRSIGSSMDLRPRSTPRVWRTRTTLRAAWRPAMSGSTTPGLITSGFPLGLQQLASGGRNPSKAS